jgi:hypothetical protein
MPSFINAKSRLLNDLLSPKFKTFRNMKKTYKGYDKLKIDGTSANTNKAFEDLLSKLTNLDASLFEVVSTSSLTISRDARRRASVVDVSDRFVGASANLIRLTKDMEGFTNRVLKNNLNQFNVGQMADITASFASIKGRAEIFEDILTDMEQVDHLANVLEAMDDLKDSWKGDYDEWEDKFENLITTYNAGVSPAREASGMNDGDDTDSIFTDVSSDASGMGRSYSIKIGDPQYLPRRFI